MRHDVAIIGGSYAGMAAGLQLLRTHRPVLIIDAGQRRNRFASHSHGFLGHDGMAPAEIAAQAKAQLHAYPNLTWRDGMAARVTGAMDDFTITLEDGARYQARRVVFALGVKDRLPDIPGLPAAWGQHVFHCPYCHGYELNKGRLAVIATGPMSVHQAEMLPDWGEVTFFPNGVYDPTAQERAELARRGVAIEDAKIARLDGAEVHLEDGRALPFAGVFVGPTCSPASDIAERAGCTLTETPFGTMIKTGEDKQTSVAGIWACGDAASIPHSVALAVGDAAITAAHVHRSLLWP